MRRRFVLISAYHNGRLPDLRLRPIRLPQVSLAGDYPMNEREKLALAKRKVEAMTGFYIHLATFVAVMTLLLIINVAASGGWWVQ